MELALGEAYISSIHISHEGQESTHTHIRQNRVVHLQCEPRCVGKDSTENAYKVKAGTTVG